MADPGSTILNLPLTVALGDTDVLPLARPSGTTAPGTDLGLTGKGLKALFPPAAPLYTAPGPATDGAMTQAATTTALGLKVDKVAGLALSSNDYTSPEKAKLATLTAASPLYGTTGTNTDGAMTQLATTTVTGLLANLITNDKSSLTSAVNEVKNLEFKSASVVLGVLPDGSGGVLTIFSTYEQAEAAASAGSDISLSGFHRSINVDKSVNISGGTVGGATIGYNSSGITARLHGMSALSRFVSCPAYNAGTVNTVEFSDLTTGPGFFLESFGLASSGLATISVLNCRARNTGSAGATGNGTAGSGLVHFQERTCTSQWNFRNCDLRSSSNVIFSGYPNAASRVTLEAATVLTPGLGKPTQDTQVINSGVTTLDANFYIDNRPAFTPITQNQYGTHPAFSAQFALNAYLLGGAATVPTTSTPTFTAA